MIPGRDPTPARLVRIDGLHAVKHAIRFGAELTRVVSDDVAGLLDLATRLAPDIVDALRQVVQETSDLGELDGVDRRPVTPVVAWARVRAADAAGLIGGAAARHEADASRIADTQKPLVLLENPRHAGNVGASIRVAAATGVAGLITVGGVDPWSEPAVRGAAGLQYAVPVARLASLDELPQAVSRRVVAMAPHGEPLRPGLLRGGPLLAFGTERAGLSAELLARADRIVSLPMQPGVSSLNLATAVAAAAYAWRLLD